jgi:iron complex outermembrane receptor protein
MNWLLLTLLALPVYSQVKQTVVVTGSYEAIPLEESERSVRSFPARDMELLTNTFADLMHLDPSLDLRQRAPGAVQSGLSIRGGGFGQTLVLLDGLRLNDVQSMNHNMDIPLPLDAISTVEVLRGSGSTLYGSDAVAGVVNFITKIPEGTEFRLRSALGNFGVNQESGSINFHRREFAEQLSFSRDFSSGFMPDRDYRNLSLASLTQWDRTHITLALNDRPFGADQFYGNYNSWERTKTWFASIHRNIGDKTEATFAYRRHSDLFVLYRDRPQVFTNRHIDESYQFGLRRTEKLKPNMQLHYGAEGLHEAIDSNNLGVHSRSRGAGYVAFDVRALRRFSFTAGVRAEIYGNEQKQFSPSVGAGYWLSKRVKLRASASRAFRLPSYTDLYYHDPANVGSPDLRPETAWSYEGGADINSGGKVRGEFNVFQRRERDGIDYVRSSPTDIWRATNLQRLNFTGVEAAIIVRGFDFRYTGIHGAQDALGTLQSKYVFNYPVHSGLISWQVHSKKGFLFRTRVGVLERYGRDPYAVWDVYTAYGKKKIHPFLQLTNLTDTYYQEILGVRTPGRGIVGGLEWVVYQRK